MFGLQVKERSRSTANKGCCCSKEGREGGQEGSKKKRDALGTELFIWERDQFSFPTFLLPARGEKVPSERNEEGKPGRK